MAERAYVFCQPDERGDKHEA
jgi:hypothetical protein